MSPTTGLRRKLLRHLVMVLLLVAVFLGLHAYQTRELVRGPAPHFSARLLDGSPVSLSDYHGGPLLLHFWATWCPVCRLELGVVEGISGSYPVLTVALDDMAVDKLQRWLEERNVSWAVVRDPAGEIAQRYGVVAVPGSIIIDGRGNIRFVETGYTTEIGLRLRLWWADR